MAEQAQIADPADRLADRWNTREQATDEAPAPEQMDLDAPSMDDAPAGDEPGLLDAAETDNDSDVEDRETAETDAGAFQTLDELLTAGDADPANLRVQIKVDGVMEEVPLSDALAGYSRTADYHRRRSALDKEREALEAERTAFVQHAQQAQQQVGVADRVLNQMYSQEYAELQQRYAGIDWHRLRTEDNAEFAAMTAEKSHAENALTARYQGLMAQLQQEAQTAQAAQSEALQKARSEFMPGVIERHPEWSDPAKWQEANQAISRYLVSDYGYPPEEVMQITDARQVDIIWKAQQWDALQAQAPKVEERIQRGSLRPGSATQQVSTHRRAVQQAHKRLRETGTQDDAVNVLVERWGGRQAR